MSARPANGTAALLLGLAGVTAFSATLPATRAAVAGLDPLFVGTGRPLVAALLAALFLLIGRQRIPTRSEAKRLAVVAAALVLGFPILIAWAMRSVDASHGGVMLGILPLGTAVAAVLLAHEHPSPGFWVSAVVGSGLVVVFSLLKGGGSFRPADLALLAAVAASAVGYAEGARLARSLGGLQVISWALVLAAPLLLLPVILSAPAGVSRVPLSSWAGFAYVCLVSQFLGFLPWYRGLSLGGIARIGQIQLLQPFLTIAISVAFLGERLDRTTAIFAILVVAVVAIGRWTTVRS